MVEGGLKLTHLDTSPRCVRTRKSFVPATVADWQRTSLLCCYYLSQHLLRLICAFIFNACTNCCSINLLTAFYWILLKKPLLITWVEWPIFICCRGTERSRIYRSDCRGYERLCFGSLVFSGTTEQQMKQRIKSPWILVQLNQTRNESFWVIGCTCTKM